MDRKYDNPMKAVAYAEKKNKKEYYHTLKKPLILPTVYAIIPPITCSFLIYFGVKSAFLMRKIRFHDLRHSCANLLISARVPLIEVQQWLGHSTLETTADLYAHLEYGTKVGNAELLKKI